VIHLVTGGARAGKSTWALARTEEAAPDGAPCAFVATAEAYDDEMRLRIDRHKAERGERWRTFEEPLAVPERLPEIAADHGAILVDCLTLWICNVLLQPDVEDAAIEARIEDLVAALRAAPVPVVLVTNEVGLGIVPADALSRRYRDLLGRCNRRVAETAERVTMLVSGLPLTLK
jgi:adenosylcobinamide kinase/adenosylcobinamide-phosphate guanylyltransferase